MINMEDMKTKVTDKTSAIIVANPNLFGLIDENAFHVSELKKDSILNMESLSSIRGIRLIFLGRTSPVISFEYTFS